MKANDMKVAVLTSEKSWFYYYAKEIALDLNNAGYNVELFLEHESIPESYSIVLILSYFRIIEKEYLNKHKHNLVVHGSDLPRGKGWSPILWQVIEGKTDIPVVIFEASEGCDEGDIYFKEYIKLSGFELHDEIRNMQIEVTKKLCLKFLKSYPNIKGIPQNGESSFYRKRAPIDSEIDIEKSIIDQFNLFRCVDNQNYPAFFNYRGKKFILQITRED